jgi:2'-5' RNA ligase
MQRAAPAKPQRLFFAVWPDEAARASIASLAREVAHASGGRATGADKIHLTLAFLGNQPAARIPALHRLAEGVDAPAFVLSLDEIGCFPRTGIAWLGARSVQSGLAALHLQLRAGLQGDGFPTDERPYAPHLTLARRTKIALRRPLAEPIAWPVRSFALVASDLAAGGSSYRTIAEWRLRPG